MPWFLVLHLYIIFVSQINFSENCSPFKKKRTFTDTVEISSLGLEQRSPPCSRGERKSKHKYNLVQFLKCSKAISCLYWPNPMENLTIVSFMVMASFVLRVPSPGVNNAPSPGWVFCGVSCLPEDPRQWWLLPSPVPCEPCLLCPRFIPPMSTPTRLRNIHRGPSSPSYAI